MGLGLGFGVKPEKRFYLFARVCVCVCGGGGGGVRGREGEFFGCVLLLLRFVLSLLSFWFVVVCCLFLVYFIIKWSTNFLKRFYKCLK